MKRELQIQIASCHECIFYIKKKDGTADCLKNDETIFTKADSDNYQEKSKEYHKRTQHLVEQVEKPVHPIETYFAQKCKLKIVE